MIRKLMKSVHCNGQKSALETFETHGQSLEKMKEKVNSIGEKQYAALEVGRVQNTIENAITSLQNQIHQILNSQQAIMKEMQIRGQNEQLLKEEIKRLEMLLRNFLISTDHWTNVKNIYGRNYRLEKENRRAP